MRTPGPTRPGRGMTTLSQGQKEEIMPSNRTTRKPRGLTATPVPEADSADTGATVAASAADGDTIAGPAQLPDTAATRAPSAALAAHPGSTVAELAAEAKIGRSTAFKAPIALEKAGLASRHLGGIDGARLRPDRWQMGLSRHQLPRLANPSP